MQCSEVKCSAVQFCNTHVFPPLWPAKVGETNVPVSSGETKGRAGFCPQGEIFSKLLFPNGTFTDICSELVYPNGTVTDIYIVSNIAQMEMLLKSWFPWSFKPKSFAVSLKLKIYVVFKDTTLRSGGAENSTLRECLIDYNYLHLPFNLHLQ